MHFRFPSSFNFGVPSASKTGIRPEGGSILGISIAKKSADTVKRTCTGYAHALWTQQAIFGGGVGVGNYQTWTEGGASTWVGASERQPMIGASLVKVKLAASRWQFILVLSAGRGCAVEKHAVSLLSLLSLSSLRHICVCVVYVVYESLRVSGLGCLGFLTSQNRGTPSKWWKGPLKGSSIESITSAWRNNTDFLVSLYPYHALAFNYRYLALDVDLEYQIILSPKTPPSKLWIFPEEGKSGVKLEKKQDNVPESRPAQPKPPFAAAISRSFPSLALPLLLLPEPSAFPRCFETY
ncbi:hypothetical protein QBC46DRAFT_409722 [Diplogelasinospora grovesii]|uniref:Uncharacterized protein n=1 Tax=Diplogelasinospora grovesii TaxID=303347 RepID=A0AAN6N716_9PEZI|nr:hypothetical protein QBC46DRAFT_409722 [Diplogelasinospora grovesii]